MKAGLLSLLGLSLFGLLSGQTGRRPLRLADVAAQYEEAPSFTDLLPWAEYLPAHRAFLLEDGCSVGAVLELEPVSCEARPQKFLNDLHSDLFGVLSNITELAPSPWIVQLYLQDEEDLGETMAEIKDYIDARAGLNNTLSTTWLGIMDEHLQGLARPGGVFDDRVVTDCRWGAKRRRVRLVLYRRFKREVQSFESTLEDLDDQLERLRSALATAGVRSRVTDGAGVYAWLLRWFNPRPAVCEGDPKQLLRTAPYPGDEDLPFGRDLAELTTLSVPESDSEKGIWRFDGMPHTAITVQGLRRVPDIGTLTAERPLGDNKVYALFDRMPPGTIMALTLICRPQDQLREHVRKIRDASIGDGAEAELARENCDAVGKEMARGDRLIPACFNIYLRAEDEKTLRRNTNRVESLLLQNGIQTVSRANDLLPGDAWVRNLPMNYDPALNRANRRSRLMFSSHIARMMPLYGRARGTGKPGFLFFNRGGNPVTFDPIAERKLNAFLLLLGPPGAGKSSTLVYLLLQVLAVMRPRIFIIEAGNSLGLTCSYLKSLGLSVHEAVMKPGSDVSLPPFAGALALLDDEAQIEVDALEDIEMYTKPPDEDDEEDDKRDLLGEMELAASIMITGGEEGDAAKMSKPDRTMVRTAILDAARAVRERGGEQVLTQDVADALRRISRDKERTERRRERAEDMAEAIMFFCDGLPGHFFNRPGKRWPDVDVIHLEMGILAHEGYEDQLTVAYTALMNHINSVVEARQHEARHTIVITDEGHVITTNPLLAPYVVKITKMWRKFGAWYWIATQNFDDFPDTTRRLLNMIEWWMCLAMPKEEIDQITQFRALTDEQRSMLLSARKDPGKYTEGVVMNTNMATLFRNVPPGLALALAQTEKDEKAARARIMRETGCTEVEAALKIAEQIDRQRTGEAG